MPDAMDGLICCENNHTIFLAGTDEQIDCGRPKLSLDIIGCRMTKAIFGAERTDVQINVVFIKYTLMFSFYYVHVHQSLAEWKSAKKCDYNFAKNNLFP